MTETQAKRQLAIRFVELMAANQVDQFSQVVAQDYKQHNPMVRQGLGGIIEAGQWFHSVFPDITVRVEQLVVENDLVVGRFTWLGTHQAEFMGIPATYRKASWVSMDLWRVEQGKLAEHWDVVDWTGLITQLQGKD